MKKNRITLPCILTFLSILLSAFSAFGSDATFSWTPNNEAVSGYNIHYGTSSGNYNTVIDTGLPAVVDGRMIYSVTGLNPGVTYYFAATAYTETEESGYSTEVVYSVPATVPSPSAPPTVSDISLQGNEDTPLTGQLQVENGADSFTITSQPDHGTLTVEDSSGSFTYTPTQHFFGSDTFIFTASNSSGTSAPATASININAVNDVPIANNSSFSVDEDGSYTGTLTATDIDQDSLSYSLNSQGVNGIASINQSGSFTYTPNQNVSGTDIFTFKVNDGTSDSNIASVSVTINAVNEPPVAYDSVFSVDEGSSYNGSLSATDNDGDNLSFSILNPPENGQVILGSSGSFTYTPSQSDSVSDAFTFQVSDGSLDSNTASVNIAINRVSSELALEVSELSVTSEWQHVDLETSFINPAVVAKASTTNDSETSVVSIRNVTGNGFDIRMKEWSYLDGVHPEELVTYFVMEQGFHQIDEDTYAAADCTTISGLINFTPITYSQSFSTAPVVISSIVTENESDTVTLRTKDITSDGFSITMQEQESNDGYHSEETICYIAWEEWSGILNDLVVEIKATSKDITSTPSAVYFNQQFPDIPYMMAGSQSANGMNTAILGTQDLSISDAKLTVLEEQSADTEIEHIPESAGYYAISPFNPDEDSDLDGLTNSEEVAIQTHPGLFDTDHDNINDLDEYNYWLSIGLTSETDSDNDGFDNLHDADSDNDSIFDGVEIALGSDPVDPKSTPALILEVGEITVGSEPIRVNFTNNYSNPVIIANSITRNDPSPSVTRVSNVTAEGFDIQIQEYDYQDNIHSLETVNYIIMEKGSYVLDNGTQFEAGLISTDATDAINISLMREFNEKPIILTSINSMNDPETVTSRIKKATSTGFKFTLQEQEVNNKYHDIETVAYLAITQGSGSTNGISFVAGKTNDSVTHATKTISYSQQFNDIPYHFAAMQTTDGKDTSTLKISQTRIGSINVLVEEETSKDSEMKHTKEVAGYFVILPE